MILHSYFVPQEYATHNPGIISARAWPGIVQTKPSSEFLFVLSPKCGTYISTPNTHFKLSRAMYRKFMERVTSIYMEMGTMLVLLASPVLID